MSASLLPWVDVTTSPANTREYYERAQHHDAAREGLHTVVRLDGRLVGHADLRITPLMRSAEVGYWLAAAAVGNGVITRVVAEELPQGFVDLAVYSMLAQEWPGSAQALERARP